MTENILLTVPNIVKCFDRLVYKSVVVENKKEIILNGIGLGYDGIRNLYIQGTVPNTRVTLSGNGLVLVHTVLKNPSEWVNFGDFTEYNILYTSLACYSQFVIEADHNINIKYEKVRLESRETNFIPSNFPEIYQECDRSLIKYGSGMCGKVEEKEVVEPKINFLLERNFYRRENIPDMSVISITSSNLEKVLKVLSENKFSPNDEIFLSYPPIGSCEFPNERKEEILKLIFNTEPDSHINIVPCTKQVLDEELREREIERSNEENAEYLEKLEFIRSCREFKPEIIEENQE